MTYTDVAACIAFAFLLPEDERMRVTQDTAAATTSIVETVEEASSSSACPKPKAKVEPSKEMVNNLFKKKS